MAVTQAASGANELLLRLPNALAGLIGVYLVFLLARCFLDEWSSLFAAMAAAVHSPLVEYGSRLAKELSYEVFFTTLIFYCGLRAAKSLSRRDVLVFGTVALTGLGMSYTASLVIAAWIPVLLILAYRSASRTESMRLLGGLSAVCVVAMGASYWWLSGAEVRGAAVASYGEGYGAWPASYSVRELSAWVTTAQSGALHFLLGIDEMWAPQKWIVATLECFVIAAGLGTIWKQSRPFFWAASLLVATCTTAGALKLWPVGNIHTMTFAVPLVCVALGSGLGSLCRRLGRGAPAAFIVLGCLGIPAARGIKYDVLDPVDDEQTRPVMEYVLDHAASGDGVFVYYAADSAFHFYWPQLTKKQGRDLETISIIVQPRSDRGQPELFSERFHKLLSAQGRVWFIFTHDHKGERQRWMSLLSERYQLEDEMSVSETSAHLFVPKAQ